MKFLFVFTIALIAVSFAGSAVAQQGPYGGSELPTGVLLATVGGSATGLSKTPSVDASQLEICGKLAQAGGTVSVSFEFGTPFSTSVGPDGSFCVRPSVVPSPGVHTLFFNGQQVGRFSVGSLVPAAPKTGSSHTASANKELWILGMTTVAAVCASLGFLALKRRS